MSQDGIRLQPCAVILKPQHCPWLPGSLWPTLRWAQLRFCYIDLRNADSCFNSLSDPARCISLGHICSHTSGLHVVREDARGAASAAVHQHCLADALWESEVELPVSLEDRPLFSIWDLDFLFKICFFLAPLKLHSLVRMTQSSRKKCSYYYFFKTSGILRNKLSHYAPMWWISTFDCDEIRALHHKLEDNRSICKEQTAKRPVLLLMF